MSILHKILLSPIVGFKWVKALELASNEDYESALDQLRTLDEYYAGRNVEYHLLCGFVNFGIGNDIEAVRHFELAVELLQDTNKYNDDERTYLLLYATRFGRKALKVDINSSEPCVFPNVDFSSLDSSKIRESLKRSFPMDDLIS